MEPLGDQHGHLDTNWCPLGDQNGSTGVIKMESLGDQHGRLDANWSPLVTNMDPFGWPTWNPRVTNMAAWMQTGAGRVTREEFDLNRKS
jgi:hypothetical protein